MNISLENLRIGYGNGGMFPEISVSINGSELIVLLGRNGVGKSTLLRTVAGLQAPLAGRIEFGDKDINSYTRKEKATLISFVSTEKFRVANLTVFDAVSLGRYSHTNWLGSLGESDRRAVAESLEMTGAAHLMYKNINEISDGELQRVMIAGSLAQDTPVIILDEPTAFLDFPNRFDILQLLRNLAWNGRKTVILSTHDLDIAMRFADNIWLMTDNRFRQGAPEDFALNRGLDNIFKDTGISFDYSTGTVNTRVEPSGEAALICSSPEIEFWLRKALGRTGFRTVKNADSVIEVCENRFILRRNSTEKVFTCIYGLIKELKNAATL